MTGHERYSLKWNRANLGEGGREVPACAVDLPSIAIHQLDPALSMVEIMMQESFTVEWRGAGEVAHVLDRGGRWVGEIERTRGDEDVTGA